MKWTLLLVCVVAWGQEFEVASIKRAAPPDATTRKLGCNLESPARYVCNKAQVSVMVYQAFGIKGNGLKFTPDTDCFDVQAKVPDGASADDIRKMMRNLLATRFQLKYHYAPMEREFYELSIARGGLKMQPSSQAPRPPTATLRVGSLASQQSSGLMHLAGTQVPISNLVSHLARIGAVVDNTGLTGNYDIDITFTRESVGEEAPPTPGMTVFEALEKVLGLKLEHVKRTIDVLVIDSYNKTAFEN